MVPSRPDKSKLSRIGSWSVVLFDWSSGKRMLETRLGKGVPGLSIIEDSFIDCQDEIDSGLLVKDVGQWLSERGPGGIAEGCAVMNDMLGRLETSNV